MIIFIYTLFDMVVYTMVFLEHTDTLILSFRFSPLMFFSMHTFATHLVAFVQD